MSLECTIAAETGQALFTFYSMIGLVVPLMLQKAIQVENKDI